MEEANPALRPFTERVRADGQLTGRAGAVDDHVPPIHQVPRVTRRRQELFDAVPGQIGHGDNLVKVLDQIGFRQDREILRLGPLRHDALRPDDPRVVRRAACHVGGQLREPLSIAPEKRLRGSRWLRMSLSFHKGKHASSHIPVPPHPCWAASAAEPMPCDGTSFSACAGLGGVGDREYL